MHFRWAAIVGIALTVAGCQGIPPVNTATISQTPASEQRYAAALRAVEICTRLPDAEAVLRGFEDLGYKRSRFTMTTRGGKTLVAESVTSLGGDLKIIASAEGCTIGLVGMTPDQSYRLAQIWVKKYGAVTNGSLGQGLSPHAVQAWQMPDYPHVRILVAAYRTWPYDSPMTSDVPGAAVRLQYR